MGSHKIQLSILFLTWASLACLCFSVPCEYSILDHDLANFPSEEVVVELFQQWREKHKKVFKNEEEEVKRFENFRNSLKYIIEKNADRTSPNGYLLGLNSFSDMSNEEFRQVYLPEMKQPFNQKGNTLISKNVQQNLQSCDSAPSSLDWRTCGIVTGVKDQGHSCGSCWAFSSTGAIEGINALHSGTLTSVSEQELVDCVRPGKGCEGGSMIKAFQWVIDNDGIDTEIDYPYTAAGGTCDTSKVQNKVVTIDGFQHVENSDDALFYAVAQQPVSVSINASSTEFKHYQNRIFDACQSTGHTHEVLVVGYGSEDGEDYWIAKNSWGTNWGMKGYINIRRDATLQNGTCAINLRASYPTKQSQHS